MSANNPVIIKKPAGLAKGDKGEPGAPGKDATFSFPISSDNILYGTQVLTDVLNKLLYVPLTIGSFSGSPFIFEKGVILTSINLFWTYNKPVQSQQISAGSNIVPPTLAPGDRNKVVTVNSIGTNFVITLTADDDVSDSNPPKTASFTVDFFDKIYWGKSSIPGSYNSSFILGLTNKGFATTRQSSFNISTGSNEYIYFCSPMALGLVTFKVNGFFGGFTLAATISFTNASGYTSSYYIYKSDNENLGLTSVVTS